MEFFRRQYKIIVWFVGKLIDFEINIILETMSILKLLFKKYLVAFEIKSVEASTAKPLRPRKFTKKEN